MSFLKSKQTQKNQYKKENIQKMAKVQEDVKQYQWLKGDNFGKTVTVESVDAQFTNFTDGSRIFNEVINEFLQEVINGRLPLPGADRIAKKLAGEEIINLPTESIPSKANSFIESEVTVVGKMIQKMSKKNVVTVPLQINLNIPTPALYAMLGEGMEEQDLNDEIMAVAMKQIEIDRLQEYIKENVTQFLQEYYS